MTERWKINNYGVEVRRRARQRSLRLRVTAKGELRITCAKTVPKREIFHFVTSNLSFIEQQLEEVRKIRERFPPKRFVEGEELLFLGRPRKLRLLTSEKHKLLMQGGEMILAGPVGDENQRRDAVRKFYRRSGKKYLSQRLEFFSGLMQLRPTSVSFRCQSSRWGSCSGEGHISLNWRLMAAPADVIDYVVVHELAHLKHHDHSPRFWKLVEEYCPNHKALKAWLNEHQWAFEFLAASGSDEE